MSVLLMQTEVGPLFPKTRVVRNTSVLGKTRDPLMDVDSATVARLVSLLRVSCLPYCSARYNAEDLPTKNIGQILRILTLSTQGRFKKALINNIQVILWFVGGFYRFSAPGCANRSSCAPVSNRISKFLQLLCCQARKKLQWELLRK